MKGSRKFWWLVYSSCAAAVLAALVWVSAMLLDMERELNETNYEAKFQSSLGLALWRMESWMLPVLSREAARPHYEYISYYPTQRAMSSMFNDFQQDEVLSPSPLLTFRPDYIHLHFQLDPEGQLGSPQVPDQDFYKVAVLACVTPGEQVLGQEKLAAVGRLLDVPRVLDQLGLVEQEEANFLSESTLGSSGEPRSPGPVVMAGSPSEYQTEGGKWSKDAWTAQDLNRKESEVRDRAARAARNNFYNQSAAPDQQLLLRNQIDATGNLVALPDEGAEVETVALGPLVPMWLGEGRDELFFFRRTLVGPKEFIQGVYFDWPALRERLLAEVEDLLSDATLVPRQPDVTVAGEEIEERALDAPAALHSLDLAAFPARLQAARPEAPGFAGFTPAEGTITVTWIAVCLALLAAGVTLRSSIEFGARRSRFASAVTHELRTPLTTFRMYSEMLADGMVKDDAQRKVYYETLKEESGRLAMLVENVLSYARVEDGRAKTQVQPIGVGALVARIRPVLERRCQDAGVRMEVEVGAAASDRVCVDAEMVSQILFNLVDNSCKYGQGSGGTSVHLELRRQGERVEFAIRDHGAGVNPADEKRIFDAFERASHDGDATPGIGLGLALAQGLAQGLGGELSMDREVETGARFVLSLPAMAS